MVEKQYIAASRISRMKVLFVNHDVSWYGAAASLSLMLQENPELSFDMIVPRWTADTAENTRQRFNIQSGKLFFLNLYMDMSCYAGGQHWQDPLSRRIRSRFAAWLDYWKFLKLIRTGQYDLIYINSLVLYKYIVKNRKTVIHIRERYQPNGNPVVRYTKQAAGVVFIDNATFAPFSGHGLKKYAVINNPFDMTGLQNMDRSFSFEGIDLRDITVFSMVGQVNAGKGILDVVRAFHRVADQKIMLFLAGNCHKNFQSKIAKICEDDLRIRVLGHRDSVAELYAVTDYLIRGEKYQCIGRTTIEALFAGCSVLVPGLEPYQEFRECLERFSDKINFYPPGDFSSLSSLIAAHAGRKIMERKYYSNVTDHVQQLNTFLEEVVSFIPA